MVYKITIFAENGISKFLGENVSAIISELSNPLGITVHIVEVNTYIADTNNEHIRTR